MHTLLALPSDPDYQISAPRYYAFPLLILNASVLLYKVAKIACSAISFPRCEHASRRIRNEPQEKIQHTQRLILKSDGNVSTEIKCYGVDNEFASRAILSRKKKNQHNSTTNLNTSEWLFPAAQLCYWFKKTHTQKNHFYLPLHLHSLIEVLSLRSLFAKSVDIDLENQLNSSGIMKYNN